MAIRIQCPSPECGAACSAADAASGRTVKCPKCGKTYVAHPTFDGQPGDTKKSRPSANENPFPDLPAEFGRYRVLRLLGRGGMGAVYLAADSQLEREVALKIPFFGASESPQRVERFVREARSAAALDHPNICTVFDAGQIDGRPFITMAHIAGAPLDRAIDPDAPMPQARAARVAHKVAAALEHAHRKGVVHRDLKPANVMIAAGGEPVVMDFGLAKRAADADPNEAKLTRAGGILGTPSYMSPEQVRGDAAAIGPASDVYSLGVMLFEMLTGRTPYEGSVGVVMGQILAAPVPSVREFRPDVDARLDAICRTAMAKDAAARFPTMAAFAARLAEYLKPPAAARSVVRDDVAVELVEETPGPQVRPAAGSPFDSLTDAPAAEDAPVRAPKSPKKRPPVAVLVAAAVAAVLLVGWLATVVFRVETPNGTLVVEVTDDEVEARIKNGKVVLTGPDGKVRYTLSAGERDKTIDAGPYKVRVEGADGLTLDTPEFTLKKGEKVTVRVTIDPKAVPKKDQKKDAPKKDERGSDPPTPSVPSPVVVTDRKAFVAKGGEWRIDGGELVQSKSELATLLFGDPAWTDYDFTFETMTEGKAGDLAGSGVGVFRARDADNLYSLLMGGYNGKWTEVNRWEKGRWYRDVPSFLKEYPVNQWHKFHVRVRGNKIVCTIDGEKTFDFAEDTFAAGRVGLRTWNGPIRFRKVTVTAPNGVVLWDGLPDVAEQPNPPPKAVAKKDSPLLDPDRAAVSAEALALAGGGDPKKAPVNLVGVIGKVEPGRSVTALSVSPDGKAVVWGADDKTLRRSTLDRPGEYRVLDTVPAPLNLVAYSPDGKSVAAATDNRMIIWDAATGKESFATDIWGVQTFAYSPDGKTLAGSDAANVVHLWDVRLGKEAHSFPAWGRVNALAFSADGATLSAASYQANGVKVWNVASGAEVSVWKDAFEQIIPLALRGAAFSPDGRLLAISHADGAISLWDPAKREKKRTLANTAQISCLKFTPDGNTLVAAGHDGVIRFWSPEQDRAKEIIPLGPAGRPLTFDIDPSGKYLFVGGQTPLIFVLRMPEPVGGAKSIDRAAAEYVLSIGGMVRVNGSDKWVARVTDLPPDAFTLTWVAVMNNSQLTDQGMSAFTGCKNLIAIQFTGTKSFSDAGLAHFSECKDLVEIHLNGTDVTDKGLAFFKDRRNLRTVLLSETKVTDDGMTQFEGMTSVRWLQLSETRVTDKGLACFEGNAQLCELHLRGTNTTDKGLSHFRNCTQLLGVWLDNTQISDSTLAQLKACKELVDLSVCRTKVTPKGVTEFKAAFPKCAVVWDSTKAAPQAPVAAGFVPLFNGKDLTGWSVDSGPADRWKVEGGQINGTGAGNASRGWLVSDKEYENFVLKLQFQVAPEGDGAVGFNARPGDKVGNTPHHLAVKLTGYSNRAMPQIGALYYWPNTWEPPNKPAAGAPAGGWNNLTVQVRGGELRVSVNGQDVQKVTLSDLAKKPSALPGASRTSGRIALQQHTGEIRFRNIEVQELPAAKAANPKVDGPAAKKEAAKKEAPKKAAAADPFPEKSVWIGTESAGTILTVTERKGETFRARLEVGPGIDRDVSGTVKDGKVLWLAKDVKAVKGNPGGDNEGTYTSDKDGDLLDFVYRTPGGAGVAGAFKLRRKPGT